MSQLFLSCPIFLTAVLATVVVYLLCFSVLEASDKNFYFCYYKKAVCAYIESRL